MIALSQGYRVAALGEQSRNSQASLDFGDRGEPLVLLNEAT